MAARFGILLGICLLGGLTHGTCGFGCGIFAMLGFSAYLPVPQAAAVTSIINLGLTLPMVLRYRKHLTLRRIVLPYLVYTVTAVLIIRVSAHLDGALLKRVLSACSAASGSRARSWEGSTRQGSPSSSMPPSA